MSTEHGIRGSALPPALRRRGAITTRARKAFLAALEEGYSVKAAAERAGKARQRFYELREADPDFAELWRQAEQAGIDALEDELRQAASEGWLEVEETIENGEVVRRVERHRKDPRLLTRLREWRRPAVDVHVNANVHPAAIEIEGFKPPTFADMLETLRSTGQMHLLPSYPRLIVEPMLPLLTPAELEAFTADVVDAEIEELPTGDEKANDGA